METIYYKDVKTNANLVIFYDGKITQQHLQGRSQWTLGRKTSVSNPDIPLFSPIVSKEHGIFSCVNGTWFYTDVYQNLNGTTVNGNLIDKEHKPSVPLKHGDILRIDSKNITKVAEHGVLIIFLSNVCSGTWSYFPLNGSSCMIGRNPNYCNLVLNKPYISSTHAKLFKQGGVWYVQDIHSMAGVYMNGKRIVKSEPLYERSSFQICDKFFILSEGNLIYNNDIMRSYEPHPEEKSILHADIVTKKVKSNTGHGMKELIRDVHLDIKEGSLVALLGTAGAGKSTVMNCLNGMDLIGVEGSVMFKGVDLMRNFKQMSYLIGSVPQNKVFHPTFTPEQEFTFAAIMRLPGDTSKSEISQRVDQTIDMLGMQGVRNNKNVKLSGGEQSRVNVGIELVADRELLCLDEPDAGLSPNLKHELFLILRKLAHENRKSILTIIHDVSEIDLFDQVIIMVKHDNVGRLAFSGTPAEARKYFGCDIRDVYSKLEANPGNYVGRY